MQTVTALGLIAFLFVPAAISQNAFPSPSAPGEIFYADPSIFAENGRYYLTGTRNAQPPGFALLESDNLREWRSAAAPTQPLILRAGERLFGTSRFWAPQILKSGADYILTYTADEQVAIAQSRTLTGPFGQRVPGPIDPAERNIDSYLFRDDDGRFYLYHVRFARGNFIWVAEFDLAAGRLKPGTLTRCFGQTEPWEATKSYASPPIMEGPAVVKLKDKYYLFYSANHFRSIDYAVGYAVADSPLGPWEKHRGNPILSRAVVGENGSGHGDVFRGPGGQLYYVYHVHYSATAVSPRRTRIAALVLSWNSETNRYDITVDRNSIIKPVASSSLNAR
jgi:xylan 1,4-beta-xylosidase